MVYGTSGTLLVAHLQTSRFAPACVCVCVCVCVWPLYGRGYVTTIHTRACVWPRYGRGYIATIHKLSHVCGLHAARDMQPNCTHCCVCEGGGGGHRFRRHNRKPFVHVWGTDVAGETPSLCPPSLSLDQLHPSIDCAFHGGSRGSTVASVVWTCNLSNGFARCSTLLAVRAVFRLTPSLQGKGLM